MAPFLDLEGSVNISIDPSNRLLGTLSRTTYDAVLSSLDQVDLPRGTVIHPAAVIVQHVYFPIAGLTSIVANQADGSGVEIAVVGREGALGVTAVLGSMRLPTESMQQIPGAALRMSASDFRALFDADPDFRRLINRYQSTLFVEAAQGSACNRLHSLAARTARWLLTTRDRMTTDEFALTHELLALMVGGSRPKVSQVMAKLEAAGAVTSSRGRIAIVDAATLELKACECYDIIRTSVSDLARSQGAA